MLSLSRGYDSGRANESWNFHAFTVLFPKLPNYCTDATFLTHAQEVSSSHPSGRAKFHPLMQQLLVLSIPLGIEIATVVSSKAGFHCVSALSFIPYSSS
jgi:hypothetical protein